jgi:hypothetical protein
MVKANAMSLHAKNINPFAAPDMFLYMLIDTTVVEQTHVVLVGDMKHVQAHGHILQNEGRTVIAPAISGRGFSKLSKLQLQYLYWSLTNGKVPPEDYSQLIQECLDAVMKIPPTNDSLIALQLIVENKVPQPLSPIPPPPVVPPKPTTTTGIIWLICTEVLEDLYNGKLPTDYKELRAEVVVRCRHEGFNESTISVQYGRWKNAQLVTK